MRRVWAGTRTGRRGGGIGRGGGGHLQHVRPADAVDGEAGHRPAGLRLLPLRRGRTDPRLPAGPGGRGPAGGGAGAPGGPVRPGVPPRRPPGRLRLDGPGRVHRAPAGELEQSFQALEARAAEWVAREALPLTGKALVRSAEMRYQGQSFEINVPLPEGPITDVAPSWPPSTGPTRRSTGTWTGRRRSRWSTSGSRWWGRCHGRPGPRPRPPCPGRPPAGPPAGLPGRGLLDAGVYERRDLRPGDTFEGPAVVEQYDTTVLVPGGYRVRSTAGAT